MNKILNSLQRIYSETETKTVLGVDFNVANDKLIKHFSHGWWGTAPFAQRGDFLYSIMLSPISDIYSSNILKTWDAKTSITFAEDMNSFIPMMQLQFLKRPKMAQYIMEDWDILLDLSYKFQEFSNSKIDFDYIKYYLEDPHGNQKIKSEDYNSVYSDFWSHYNSTDSYNLIKEIIDYYQINKFGKFNAFEDNIPEKTWANRARNIIMSFACLNCSNYEFKDLEDAIWNGFINLKAYDFEDIQITNIIGSSSELKDSFYGMLDYFYTPHHEYSDDIKNHPLFKVYMQMHENYHNYNGALHLEAAKIIDKKMNKPMLAWNTLVEGGYWSGRGGSTSIEIWEEAINLSKKHKWDDLNKTLRDQINFYKQHK